MPTAALLTWSNQKLQPSQDPEDARTFPVAMKLSTGTTDEYLKGTVMGQITATGKWVAYDDDGTDDGRRVARAILVYDISVDTSGNIVLTETAGGVGEHHEVYSTVPVYYKGTFNCADLVGLDAAAVADLGRLITGDASTGVLSMP